MKHLTLLIWFFLISSLAFNQSPTDDPHWHLVWEDNFNTYNPDIWHKSHLFDGHGGAGPLVYLDQNITVDNGNLVLTINKESFSCPSWALDPEWFCVRQYETGNPYTYTSGRIQSKEAYNTQFGYIEARVKVPPGFGFFPAFWVYLGEGVSNPSNAAEIDIFEILSGTYPNTSVLTTNYHLEYPSATVKHVHELIGFNYTDWHTYAIEWSPSKIIWYVDGFPIRTFSNHVIIDPVRIAFNVGLDPNNPPNLSTPFPSQMLVDYVRVYELRDYDCDLDLYLCDSSFDLYLFWYLFINKSVRKNITIGNGSCNNSLFTGHNIHMRASEGVLINGDFFVPIGAELYVDVNECD